LSEIERSQPEQAATDQSPFTARQILVAGVILAGFYGCSFLLGGELGAIVQAGLETVPFAILAILAYLAVAQKSLRWMAVAWLYGLVALIAFLAFNSSFLAVLVNPVLRPGMIPEFIEGGLINLVFICAGLGSSVLAGSLGFLPAFRQGLSRRLPIDPLNFVHTIALVTVLILSLLPFMPLIFLGEPPLLVVATGFADSGETFVDRDNAGLLRDQVYRLAWLIPSVIFAVGYGIRRNLWQALARLGLVRPSLRQIIIGVGLATLLVVVVTGLDLLLGWLWEQTGWARTDGQAFGLIVDFALTPIGAVVLGVTAGLGEELAIRGVLQPRMGIILSNLLFTSLHALQYNWDGLIVVFFIGLFFGFIRRRSNTTVCAIIHGFYDFIIILAVVLEMPGFEF
jgi:membrane protease YdiL (CAAX protease family)